MVDRSQSQEWQPEREERLNGLHQTEPKMMLKKENNQPFRRSEKSR